jgi:hypothetical protein
MLLFIQFYFEGLTTPIATLVAISCLDCRGLAFSKQLEFNLTLFAIPLLTTGYCFTFAATVTATTLWQIMWMILAVAMQFAGHRIQSSHARVWINRSCIMGVHRQRFRSNGTSIDMEQLGHVGRRGRLLPSRLGSEKTSR